MRAAKGCRHKPFNTFEDLEMDIRFHFSMIYSIYIYIYMHLN